MSAVFDVMKGSAECLNSTTGRPLRGRPNSGTPRGLSVDKKRRRYSPTLDPQRWCATAAYRPRRAASAARVVERYSTPKCISSTGRPSLPTRQSPDEHMNRQPPVRSASRSTVFIHHAWRRFPEGTTLVVPRLH